MAKKIVIALMSFAVSGLVNAQVLEEIIVTAQKREQNIQDVGIAITAFSGEQMRQLGYTNAQQITALAPGVHTVQPNGEANYALGIRGAANSDFVANQESPVSLYVDEVYISQMSGAGFMLFDMNGWRSCAGRKALYTAVTPPADWPTSSPTSPSRSSAVTAR